MKPTLAKRMSLARDALAEVRYVSQFQPRAYYMNSIAEELEYDRANGNRVIAPNHLGLYLITLGWDIEFYAHLAWFILTGKGKFQYV